MQEKEADFSLFGDVVRMPPLTYYRLPHASTAPSWRLHIEWLDCTAVPDCAAVPDSVAVPAASDGEEAPALEPGRDDLLLVREGAGEVLRWPDVADFESTAQGIQVRVWARPHPWLRGRLETCLLGPVLAYRLERHGLPALHASAVVLPAGQGAGSGGAVGFLAGNHAGKSTLSVSLLAAMPTAATRAAGAALLTDDILALEQVGGVWHGRPGYPQVRLWPEAVEALLGLDPELLRRVHPACSKRRVEIDFSGASDAGSSLVTAKTPAVGRFCAEARPLRALYLPRRLDAAGAAIHIELLSMQEALFELLRCSFLPPDLLAAVGLQAERLELLSRLVRDVPVKRLTYPSGYEGLPRVHEAVLADIG